MFGDHFWRLRPSSAAHSRLPSLLGKGLEEFRLGHLYVLDEDFHQHALVVADVAHHFAQLAHEAVDQRRRQLELEEFLSHLVAQFRHLLVGDVGSLGGGLLEFAVVVAQQFHAALYFFRIGAGRAGFFVVAGGLDVFLFVIGVVFSGQFLGFGQGGVGGLFQVGKAGQDFAEAALAVQMLVVFFQQQFDGQREAGQRGLHPG